jgi:hypothetical protein
MSNSYIPIIPEINTLASQIFPHASDRSFGLFTKAVEGLHGSSYYSSSYIVGAAVDAFGRADKLAERAEDFGLLLEMTYPVLIPKFA